VTNPTHDAELFCRIDCLVGEGPFWQEGRLYWVDILESRLHSCNEIGADLRTLTVPSHLGAAAPWRQGFICGTKEGFGTLARDGSFKLLPGSPPMPADMRCNDGKLDPSGRFWCGTNEYSFSPGKGALYRVDRNGDVKRMLEGLILPNGLDWDESAGLFYFIDTFTHRVDVFDYNAASGEIANRRIAFETPKEFGLPDGMARDSYGRLWIAFWGGSRVVAFDPRSGRPVHQINVPTRLTSSCWIGQRTLYITTARNTLPPTVLAQEPLAGSVFRAELPR
jgi:sugar lactone lactonase YvrE